MKIDLDEEGFNALADVRCLVEGGQARFMMRGRGATAVAPIGEDGCIHLLTERSASHRELAAVLGATDAGQAAIQRGRLAPAALADIRAARRASASPRTTPDVG